MEFTDGQIAPCIQCGNSAIAHEIAVGGKRQILPVCNTCLDPAEQKKRLILVIQQQLDQLPPTDVAVCLYFSRHRDLLDPDVRANIAAHAPEDAPDPEVALTVVEGGQNTENPVILVAPGPDCEHQHVTVLVDQGDGLTRITCNDCDACAEVTSATLAACPGTLEVMLEVAE